MSRIETALDSWRQWDTSLDTRPVVIGPLAGGRSNRSFLLESGGEKMVLRINAPATALPDPNRAVEARVWRVAGEAGTAPRLVYADPGGGFLVSAYVENNLPAQPQDDPVIARKALGLLQRCHRLEVSAPEIDYAAHVERYWQVIRDRGIEVEPGIREQHETMHDLLEDIINSGQRVGLCHHDPVVENFVGSPERLHLIDWEYAARGLQVLDYAAFAVEWRLGNATIAMLTGFDAQLLCMASKFYRYQCHLWEAITLSRHCGLAP